MGVPKGMAALTVHGKGGHGRVVTKAAILTGYIVHSTDDAWHTKPGTEMPCHVAIGDNKARKIYDRYNLKTIIHPTAYVDESAQISEGVFIGARAVVHVGAKVGRGAIINTGAIVEHDCVVGDWAHLAPGSVICGRVNIGEGVFLGANAVVRQTLFIKPWVTVGCGAAVVRDITEPGTYAGVPARRIGG